MKTKTYKNGNLIKPEHHREAQKILYQMHNEGKLKKVHNYGAYHDTRNGVIDSEFIHGDFRFVYILEKFIPVSLTSVGNEHQAFGVYYEFIGQ